LPICQGFAFQEKIQTSPSHEHSTFVHTSNKIACSHFGICGGCQWQHVAYASQLAFKERQVRDNLTRIAKVPLPEFNPILDPEHEYYYRNKLEFTFSLSARWLTENEIGSKDLGSLLALGFSVPGRFDQVLEVKHCHLQPDPRMRFGMGSVHLQKPGSPL
jgi:tRNA/tmRNA/rRNA uracil-C5-methylase (TrmA/RlmC/RlmD family)